MSIRVIKALRTAGWYLVLSVLGILFAFPFVWMIFNGFQTAKQAGAYPPSIWPNPWSLYGYIKGFTSSSDFVRSFFNSAFISLMNVVGALFSSTLAGYGFAKLRAPGKSVCFIILLATMMIPSNVTLLPIYAIYSKLNWLDTFIPLILPAFLGASAFNIFLMRQFFAGIPKELGEAARVDGANMLQVFYRIFLPNTKPAMFVVVLFTFVGAWNDFFAPLVFLTDPKKYTLAVGLNFFKGQFPGTTDYAPLMAMATFAMLPILLLFLFAQRYFVEGITTTGLKG